MTCGMSITEMWGKHPIQYIMLAAAFFFSVIVAIESFLTGNLMGILIEGISSLILALIFTIGILKMPGKKLEHNH